MAWNTTKMGLRTEGGHVSMENDMMTAQEKEHNVRGPRHRFHEEWKS